MASRTSRTSTTSSEENDTVKLSCAITEYLRRLPARFRDDCDISLYYQLKAQHDRFHACVNGTEEDNRSPKKMLQHALSRTVKDITDRLKDQPDELPHPCYATLWGQLKAQSDPFDTCVNGTNEDGQSLEELLRDANSLLSRTVETKLEKLVFSTETLWRGSLRMEKADEVRRDLISLSEWAEKCLSLPSEVPDDALTILEKVRIIVEMVMPQTILQRKNHKVFLVMLNAFYKRAKKGPDQCVSEGNDVWSIEARLDQLEWIVRWVVMKKEHKLLNEKEADLALRLLGTLKAWDHQVRNGEPWKLKLEEWQFQTLKKLEDTVTALMTIPIFQGPQTKAALRNVRILSAWVQGLQPQMDSYAVMDAFSQLRYFMELLLPKTLLPKGVRFPVLIRRIDALGRIKDIEQDLADVEFTLASLRRAWPIEEE